MNDQEMSYIGTLRKTSTVLERRKWIKKIKLNLPALKDRK